MGTGEVARYLGTLRLGRGSRKAVLLGAIPPFLLKTDDNPEGVDRAGLRRHQGGRRQADRYAYFKDFLDNFYNVDELRGTRISEQALAGQLERRRRRLAVRRRTPASTPG